jgi:hypothetical protein
MALNISQTLVDAADFLTNPETEFVDYGDAKDAAQMACWLREAAEQYRAERTNKLTCSESMCDGPVRMTALGVACDAHDRAKGRPNDER